MIERGHSFDPERVELILAGQECSEHAEFEIFPWKSSTNHEEISNFILCSSRVIFSDRPGPSMDITISAERASHKGWLDYLLQC